ncbi:hypothetical protein ACFSN5_10120 [Streptococcus tangpeifui]|uniref:hypothetical protein n=1 Tax=Streptococcus tangpeifui TaxID=2709400 RepID=UPI0013EC67CE|nr:MULTISPECIES: hypothetical protein [unclassified Streptococcus]
MGIFQRLFGKTSKAEPISAAKSDSLESSTGSDWELLPAFIPADPQDVERVSVIATAIAAGDRPDSKFLVKRVLQRNPEVKTISIIAASIAAGTKTDSQLSIKNIYKKKD